jgi:hypothetical protein
MSSAYQEDGVVIVDGLLDQRATSVLKVQVERYARWMAKAALSEWVRYEADGSIHTMHYLDRVDPFFLRLGGSADLRALVEGATGSLATFSSIETFNKPARSGSPSLVHQDGVYFAKGGVSMVHLWIALDDATRENGAVQYWLGSGRTGILPSVTVAGDAHFRSVGPAAVQALGAAVPAELAAGSAIIHSDTVVHASPPNLSDRPRLALAIAYYLDLDDDRRAWLMERGALRPAAQNEGASGSDGG